MTPTINLSAVTSQQLVYRAREIIAGRETPPPIVARQSGGLRSGQQAATANGCEKGPMTDAGCSPRWQEDWLNFQAAYGGHLTACFTTQDGTLAVLACGEDEVRALIVGLTDDERKQVVIEFPDPPLNFIPAEEAGGPRTTPDAQEAESVGRG